MQAIRRAIHWIMLLAAIYIGSEGFPVVQLPTSIVAERMPSRWRRAFLHCPTDDA